MANDHADQKHRPEPEHGSAKLGDKPRDKSDKPTSEQATHQGGGVNKDHKPHGAGPIPKGRS